uniref:Uncharacterized protein n=1 Tax=Mycena chlorophos TaxID=658473 RepID=A0ABQ0LVA0_MYCCL|nr:predicted protein [Mycena chlorophos]
MRGRKSRSKTPMTERDEPDLGKVGFQRKPHGFISPDAKLLALTMHLYSPSILASFPSSPTYISKNKNEIMMRSGRETVRTAANSSTNLKLSALEKHANPTETSYASCTCRGTAMTCEKRSESGSGRRELAIALTL